MVLRAILVHGKCCLHFIFIKEVKLWTVNNYYFITISIRDYDGESAKKSSNVILHFVPEEKYNSPLLL
jgi:hypothetical protein